MVRQKRRFRFPRKTLELFAVAICEQVEEVAKEQWQILFTISQGREPQFHHADPEEQVLAERLCRHHGPQVPVGGGDDSNIQLTPGGGADALHLLVLDNAKQLRLRRQTHVADFIQQDSAAARCLK